MKFCHNKPLYFCLATNEDIDIIFDIFNRAFKYSLKWKMKLYSKLWLSHVIHNTSCEIWLAKDHNTPIGVLMLVNDYKKFLKIRKNKWLRICWFINLFYPPSLIFAVIRFIKMVNSRHNEVVTLQLILNKSEKRKALSIEQIVILPEVQGQGYGNKLVNFAKSIALKRQYNMLTLSVNKRNTSAYHLYLKHQFIEG